MKLAYYDFEKPIEFVENKINILVIENPKVYRRIIGEMYAQCSGENGNFVFSENNSILEMSKCAEIITDPLFVDINSKKLLNKLNVYCNQLCNESFDDIYNLIGEINEMASRIKVLSEYSITYSDIFDFSPVIKMLDLRFDADDISFGEKLLEYIKISTDFLKTKLFVFVGLKSFMTEEETKKFYDNLCYGKHTVLLIEQHYSGRMDDRENYIIIDNDLCEI